MDLCIGGVQIGQSQNMKLLGVNIDSVLNFSNHIGELCRKTSQQIGLLRRLKNLLPCCLHLTKKNTKLRTFWGAHQSVVSAFWAHLVDSTSP